MNKFPTSRICKIPLAAAAFALCTLPFVINNLDDPLPEPEPIKETPQPSPPPKPETGSPTEPHDPPAPPPEPTDNTDICSKLDSLYEAQRNTVNKEAALAKRHGIKGYNKEQIFNDTVSSIRNTYGQYYDVSDCPPAPKY